MNCVDFAISESDCRKFGCPICGYAQSKWDFSGGGGYMMGCQNELCKERFFVLHDGINEFIKGVSFGHIGKSGSRDIKPKLKPHPRSGMPAWGKRQDEKPSAKGEFFTNPDESGYNHGLCFVCKACCRLPVEIEWPMKNLFSIDFETRCEKSAKRVGKLFNKAGLWATRLCFGQTYPHEFYLINVSACYKHRPNLLSLKKIAENKGVITEKVLRKVKALK